MGRVVTYIWGSPVGHKPAGRYMPIPKAHFLVANLVFQGDTLGPIQVSKGV